MTVASISFYKIRHQEIEADQTCAICLNDFTARETIIGHPFGPVNQTALRVHAFHLECMREALLHRPNTLECPICRERVNFLSKSSILTGQFRYMPQSQSYRETFSMRVVRIVGLTACGFHLAYASYEGFHRSRLPSLGLVGLDLFHLFVFYYYPNIRNWLMNFSR